MVLCASGLSLAATSDKGSALVASWEFGSEEATPLEPHGGVHRDQPGPRPPEYPDFDPQNTAVSLDGKGARFSFADPGKKSRFDFSNGDEITLEAWVKVEELNRGANLYIIGKGRTGNPHFARDNQNWALRLREAGGTARISFLFATPREVDAPKSDGHWHRWTTANGFKAGKVGIMSRSLIVLAIQNRSKLGLTA